MVCRLLLVVCCVLFVGCWLLVDARCVSLVVCCCLLCCSQFVAAFVIIDNSKRACHKRNVMTNRRNFLKWRRSQRSSPQRPLSNVVVPQWPEAIDVRGDAWSLIIIVFALYCDRYTAHHGSIVGCANCTRVFQSSTLRQNVGITDGIRWATGSQQTAVGAAHQNTKWDPIPQVPIGS